MSLNTLQQRAAFAPVHGAQKIVAGAGTGKTSTMVERFVHLVAEHGLDPTRIVAVTFTNKAAGELRRRITAALLERGMIADSAQLDTAWIGTFHTLCLRILREHCYTVGFDRGTTVVEPLAERLLVNDITEALLDGRVDGSGVDELEALDVDAVVKVAGETFDIIRRAKGRGLDPDGLERCCGDGWSAWWTGGAGDLVTHDTEAAAEKEAVALVCAAYREYERRLAAAGLIDFDGIVLRTLRALTEHPQWRARLREQFQYVIVDEYQDTSRSQAAVIRLLAHGGMSNVAVVGDPRQSIYGWRDADIRNILDFAGAEHILDVNYRSYQEILDLAGHVIGVDPLFADDSAMVAHDGVQPRLTPDGADPVVVTLATSAEDEARWLAGTIRALHDRDGVAWQDIALLTRLRNPPIAFEQALRAAGVPYITGAGYGFYEREEIKDVVALLAVIDNPLDDRAVVRLLQSPMARVSDGELAALVRGRLGSGRHGRHVWDALTASEQDGFPEWQASTAARLRACLELVRSLQAGRAGRAVRELVQDAIDRGGAVARAAADTSESDRRTGNLRKLVRLAAEFEASAVFSGVGDFLRYIDLHERFAIDEPEADDVDADAVRFMTVHAAKGLEFPYVFFAYVQPARRVHRGFLFLDDDLGLVLRSCNELGEDTTKFTTWTEGLGTRRPTDLSAEELRRTVYVAITRAQKRLYVSSTRRAQPDWDSLEPLVRIGEDDYFHTIAAFARERGWRTELAAGAVAGTRPTGGDGTATHAVAEPLPLPPRAPIDAAAPSPSRLEVSFTQVDVLAQCPLRYRYLFEWRVPAPPDDLWPDSARHQNAIRAGVIGDLVHRTLQACHPRGRVELDLPGIHAAWARATLGVLSDVDAEQLWAREAAAMFTHYIESPISRMETLATEQEFNLAVDVDGTPVMIRGFIDRLCRDDSGGLLVVDYKTNRDISAATHAAHDRQLAIYRRAVTEALRFSGEVGACVLALRTGTRIEGGRAAWSEVEDLLRRLVSGDRTAPASPPCGGCAFAHVCPSSRAR